MAVRQRSTAGDATATEIDHEAMLMLKNAYDQAKDILVQHREALDKIAAFLIERETITGKEFMEILHQVEGTALEEQQPENIALETKEDGEIKIEEN